MGLENGANRIDGMKLFMRRPSVVVLALTLAATLALGACGQKGPLLPAASAVPAAPAAAASDARSSAAQPPR